MNDYPATAKFLTKTEKDEVARRLDEDRSSLAEEFHWDYFWDALKDWKIWFALVSWGSCLMMDNQCSPILFLNHYKESSVL